VFPATGLTTNQNYKFAVKARNAYADSLGVASVASNIPAQVAAGGPPNAPTGLTATPSTTVSGRIVLSWTPPAGTYGGLSGYTIYNSDNTILSSSVGGAATSFNVDGLAAFTTYGFYIQARNPLADTVGVFSASSLTVTAAVFGAPVAATSLAATTSTTIPGRVTLTWTAGNNTDRFQIMYGVTSTPNVSYGYTIPTVSPSANNAVIDGLVGGVTYHFLVRSQNTLTDSGFSTGTESATISAVPSSTLSSAVASVTATNTTNTALQGTYQIISTPSATSFTYDVPITNAVSTTTIPSAASPTLANDTNLSLYTSGSPVTVTAAGLTTVTYTKNGTNVAVSDVSSGSIVDATNRDVFNGTYTVFDVTDGASTAFIRYPKTASNIAEVDSTGTVTNASNVIFNTDRVAISAVSEDTVTYSKINANVEDTSASGTITNLTNQNVFNIGDAATVLSIGNHNIIRYIPTTTVGVAPQPISIGTVTISLANPAVFTKSAHGLANKDLVYITTTGALPNTVVSYKEYYVRNVTANTFNLSTTVAGTLITTASLSQSGTHTLYLSPSIKTSAELLTPYGEATRGEKTSTLDIKYRSGWLG
jgi:hypothetical protein